MRPSIIALLAALTASPSLAADGARTFATVCRGCHAEASTPMAPTLKGVFAAKVAGRADFKDSPALTAKAGVWTAERLDAFLKSPAAFAPGTRMMISVSNPADRAAVIAYLQTLN